MVNTKNGTIGIDVGDPNAARRLLVKFTVKDRRQVPPGIPEVERPSDRAIDDRHAQEAVADGQLDRAKVGVVRDSRVDTGTEVINLQLVQAALLRRGLTNNGFRLTNSHYFQKPGDNRFFIVLEFAFIGDLPGEPEPLPRQTVEALRELANRTWQFCNVWFNGTARPATINFGGMLNGNTRPKHSLVARDCQIMAAPTTAMLTEGEE